jgi:hypothetical protein
MPLQEKKMSDQQPQDPRQILAKMAAEEEAAVEKAKQLAEQNKAKREAILKQLREDDLKIVKEKCQLHGFTATDLRGALKTKGASTKSTPRKSTKSRASTRKKAT